MLDQILDEISGIGSSDDKFLNHRLQCNLLVVDNAILSLTFHKYKIILMPMMYDVQLTITVIEHKVSRCLLINVIQNQIASYSLISRVNYSNLLFT